MKKLVNGKYIEMTDAEITEMQASMQAENTKAMLMERSRPLTEQEVTRMLLSQSINGLSLDDNTALRAKDYYPTFEDMQGKTVDKGFKFQYGGKLYRTEQPEYTFATTWLPGSTGTESLFSEVCETHTGAENDPIPYSGNMELTEGLYYTQDWAIYRCIRSTGQPVYHALSDLVGNYVEVV